MIPREDPVASPRFLDFIGPLNSCNSSHHFEDEKLRLLALDWAEVGPRLSQT